MQTMIIGVAGPSAGGKTSITEAIRKEVGAQEVLIIKYDDYYKDQSHMPFEQRIKTNYDHPNAFDTTLLIEDIKKLKQNQPIDKPKYDFTNHTRMSQKEKVNPQKVIIIEGIFALLELELRELLDIKVYVYEDSDICFIRRLKRDIHERQRTMDNIIEQYVNTVKPMQERFIEPTKKYADVIILRGRENEVAIKMISDNIKKFLKKNNEEK